MKKILMLALLFSLILSACAIPFLQPTVAPAPTIDLEATAAVFVQASLQAQPTPTLAPSNTAVVTTPTLTEIPSTATETQNPAVLTLTATLGPGTVTSTGTLATSTPTQVPVVGATATETLHPRFYGTQPPQVRFVRALLVNRAKAEAYLSLQCTTSDGVLSISEYPVRRRMEAKVPVGNCIYVAWVGGNKMFGSFVLHADDQLTITLFKDKVVIAN